MTFCVGAISFQCSFSRERNPAVSANTGNTVSSPKGEALRTLGICHVSAFSLSILVPKNLS